MENKTIKVSKEININNDCENELHWMLFITPLAGVTGIYAWYSDLKYLAIAEWCLVLSSIYYWSKCKDQFRRYVDIFVVQISFYIHLAYVFTYGCFAALTMYIFSIVAFGLGHKYDSNICHSFVWIFACIGNYFLIKYLSSHLELNK
jgi:hypothetical protein